MMDDMIRRYASAEMLQVVDAYYRMADSFGFEQYMRGFAERSAYLRQWTLFLATYPLVLTPATLQPAFAVNQDLQGSQQVRDFFASGIYISSMNLLGLPAAIVPVALHGNVPVGVQLIGRRYREDTCLDAAQAIENAAGVFAAQLWRRER